jgi:protein-disulfide isomerase
MQLDKLLATGAVALALAACGDPRDKATPDKPGTTRPQASTSASALPVVRKTSPHAEAALKALEPAMLESKVQLNERETTELKHQLAEAMSPCPDVPVPLAQCLAEKRECKLCAPAGSMLTRAVRAGLPSNESVALLNLRFDAKSVKDIPLGNAPTKGPADAPVTLIEYADFECPFCAAMVPVIDLLTERFPGQIRIVYKTYALPAHPHAPEAAFAALAAYRQGKFWEMQRTLFDNQKQLEKKDLFRYARELDLDMAQFKKDFEAEDLRKLLKDDIEQGDSVGVEGTPTMFVNGRLVPMEKLAPFYEELENWVKLEIELQGKTPATATEKYHAMKKELMAAAEGASPAPDTSASASPSAAPSAASSASASPRVPQE